MTCRAGTCCHTSGAVNAPSEYAAMATGASAARSRMARSRMALSNSVGVAGQALALVGGGQVDRERVVAAPPQIGLDQVPDPALAARAGD